MNNKCVGLRIVIIISAGILDILQDLCIAVAEFNKHTLKLTKIAFIFFCYNSECFSKIADNIDLTHISNIATVSAEIFVMCTKKQFSEQDMYLQTLCYSAQ